MGTISDITTLLSMLLLHIVRENGRIVNPEHRLRPDTSAEAGLIDAD
jgi:hypothetical protein